MPDIAGGRSENAFALRSVPDAFRIKAYLDERKPKHAVVVGGGAIGVELAENLRRAGLGVSLVEMRDHALPFLDREMACIAENCLLENGVKLYLGRAVRALEKGAALLDDASRLRADATFFCVGARPDGRLAREAGLPVTERGAIVVDEHMRTADERIYAVGDAAAVPDLLTGEAAAGALAGPANKQGRIAADNVCGIESAYRGAQGSCILKIFDQAAAATGLSEEAARRAGLDADAAYIWTGAHAAYYPGARDIALKVVFEKKSGRLLGAQAVGGEGVDKRVDVMATAVRAGMTAGDLAQLELCYAPPFSSAKDPINQAGCAMENLLTGKVRQIRFDEVDALPRDASTLLDVRAAQEFGRGHIEGAVNIPLEALRGRLERLDRAKPVYVNCQTGLRSYAACRILMQSGFDCYNLAGGYRLYEAVRRARKRTER